MQIGFGISLVRQGIAKAFPSFTVTLDNLVNLTGGGTTNVFMTGSTGGGGVIMAKASATRFTGVAPLYVNFDATATTSTLSTNPSHELFFAHDFGDSGAGVWANGVQSAGLTSKNAGFGPVSGHVYETPGTYTYTLTVMDGVNVATRTKTITVQDPNVVYAGANTICLSTSGNFVGAPAGSSQLTVTSDLYAELVTTPRLASNKRFLFCKADSWTCSSQIVIAGISSMTIGGYGTGAAATFGSGTMVSVTPSALNGSLFSCNAGNSDLRICNFKIAADSTTSAIGLNNSITQMLAYKVEIRGCSAGFSAAPGGGGTNNVFDQHHMYECLVDGLYGEPFVDTPRAVSAFDDATDTFTAVAHPFAVNRAVKLISTPPIPLSTSTTYYISTTAFTADTFRLSATLGGAALALTSSGSCTVALVELHGGVGAFVGLVRGGMSGCYFDSCNVGEQTVRLPFLDRAHINNNYFARPNQTKNVLKIHSFNYAEVALYSEKFVVSGNVMDLRGGYSYNATTTTEVGDPSIIIGNGGSSGNERVRNGIVENNFTYGCLGQPKSFGVFAQVNCPNVTVRNNIADFSLGDRATPYASTYAYMKMNMVITTSSTPDGTIGVNVYNNTYYSNLSNGEIANFVYITDAGANPQADNIRVKNNLWYLPFHANANKTAVYNTSNLGTNIVTTTNTDSVSGATLSPNFVATPPVLLTDWRPNTGSYAINSGTTVPVLRDFNMATRVGGTYDMGAVLP